MSDLAISAKERLYFSPVLIDWMVIFPLRAGLVVCLFIAVTSLSHAQFSLDFVPNDGSYLSNDAYVSCGMSYISDANCSSGGGRRGGGGFHLNGSHDDGSAFYQRVFSDAAGNRYFQVIVGDYTVDDFVLEYITKTGDAADGNWFNGVARSSSAGAPSQPTFNMSSPYDTPGTLSSVTGTGTGNPERVIMRQLFSDAESSQEFLKDQFDKKPLIRQTNTTGDIVLDVEFDMRDKNYSDVTAIDVANKVIIRTMLFGAGTAGNSGDFDLAEQAGAAHMTAGAYTYTPGEGDNDFGGSNGTYTYAEAAFGDFFDPNDKDYSVFCDPFANSNWSGNGACTNADGTGTGGGGRRGMGM